MTWIVFSKLIAIRVLVVLFALLLLGGGLALIDYLYGTKAIAVLWQWGLRLWQLALNSLKVASRFLIRLFPEFIKRFFLRKSLSGVWRLVMTGFLTILFAVLGGHTYHRLVNFCTRARDGTVGAAVSVWQAELWFFPRWIRACIFLVAVYFSVLYFIEIQRWAAANNSPSFLGIDPWSLLFGFAASFFLTSLPLIGFDQFVTVMFRPLQKYYRRFIRGRGFSPAVANWLLAFRPLRRRAELERIRYMRKWRHQSGTGQQELTDDETSPRKKTVATRDPVNRATGRS